MLSTSKIHEAFLKTCVEDLLISLMGALVIHLMLKLFFTISDNLEGYLGNIFGNFYKTRGKSHQGSFKREG